MIRRRRSISGLLLLGVVLFALSGCAVSSNVSRFHRMTADLRGASFVVVPTKAQTGSPEFLHYAQRVAGHLIQHGFVTAPPGTTARLQVEITYRVGAAETTTRREPVYDPWYDPWYGPRYGVGVYGSNIPWGWGITGYTTVTTTVYPRIFELRIIDRRAPAERATVFEGRAVNNGTDPTFAAVGDCLIDALFYDFPGTSGNRRSIAVPTAQCK
jgi:hypothetical protein